MADRPVSLICTVLNEASTITSLVESVAAMDRLPDECIVVDAGSTDGTAELLARLAERFPWLKVVSEPGCNIARGRNIAVRMASHRLLAMVDAGCVVDRRWLSALVAAKEADREAAIVAGWTRVLPTNRFEEWVALLQTPPERVDRDAFLPSARSVLVEKAVWEALRGFPEDLTFAGEDTLFMARARERGFRIAFAAEAFVMWQPQRSARAYLRQYHRYGIGDGEAKLHLGLNLKLALLCAAVPAFIAGLFAAPAVALAAAAVLAAGYLRLVAPLRQPSVPAWKMAGAYGFFLLTQFAQVAGYARGRFRPAPAGARKRIAMCMFGALDRVPPVINEGRSLAEAGCTVELLGLRYHPGQPAREEVAPGFRLRRIDLVSRRLVGDDDRFELLRYAEMALRSFFWCFARNADLYVAHDLIALPYVYPAARLRKRPVVYRAHEIWSEQKEAFPRAAFWRALDGWFSLKVDLIVAPEIHRARIYRDEYGAPELPLVVYNCSKLIPRQERTALRALLKERGLEPRCIAYYHGGISAERRIDAAVEALALLPGDIVLVLVGAMEEPFRAWLASRSAGTELARRVVLLGPVEHGPALYGLCAGADVGLAFINGSCRNNRFNATATNKLFEYMMCGLPMITSDYEGYAEFVEGQGIGVCVDAASPAAIAGAIGRIAGDAASARAMGERARALAGERYHWDAVAPALVERYQRLMMKGKQ
jgi:glycosyltransferase involved in cell wall biosynthesis